ncbi:chitosanase [Kitasatospora sp. NPDC094011]|uniref:chitosanase n=1 Tax=Kitasatospora sp. NPDC094011 TaxID=3364090 RepID=UPI0037FC6BE7
MPPANSRTARPKGLHIATAAVLITAVTAGVASARPHRTTQPLPSASGSPSATADPSSTSGLNDPHMKDIAQQLVSSAENSSLNWKAQFAYIEDIKDGRGYTGGIIGFCSGTGDMLDLVKHYEQLKPGNPLSKYLPVLQKVNGSASHSGLDPDFVSDWKKAAQDPAFQQAQTNERDRVYFNPAVMQAQTDGLHALGQFAYYDAIVMHGPGDEPVSFGGIRAAAMKKARTPAQGGDEKTYLAAFLDARRAAMKTEAAHEETDRVDTEQEVFLRAGNLDLHTPLVWKVYGESYRIDN